MSKSIAIFYHKEDWYCHFLPFEGCSEFSWQVKMQNTGIFKSGNQFGNQTCFCCKCPSGSQMALDSFRNRRKTFYPRSNLKNDLWRYIVHRKVMIRWKRFWKKQSSQHRRWLLSVFYCKLRLCLIIIGVVCGKKILKLPVLIKRHVKLLCRWNMFSIILQFPEQIYRCIQERR